MDRRYFLTIGGAAALSLPFLAGCTTAGARAPMAQRTLGARFDLKQFHEVLKDGALPLDRPARRRSCA